MNTVLMV